MPQKARCVSKAGGFVSVSLTEFYPAMMVLQYGTALAVLILLLEILYFHRSVTTSLYLGNVQQIHSSVCYFLSCINHSRNTNVCLFKISYYKCLSFINIVMLKDLRLGFHGDEDSSRSLLLCYAFLFIMAAPLSENATYSYCNMT